VNNTDVEAPNPACKPKLDINRNLSLKFDRLIWILFQNQQRCWSRDMLYLVKDSLFCNWCFYYILSNNVWLFML